MFVGAERPSTPHLLRFGLFEVDVSSGEMRKSGARVGLQPQPFRVLARLLETPGRIVTRDELRRELWPNDTFVDFEHSVNVAVARVREALGDDAERPRFVETLPKRGYRFIAPVEAITGGVTRSRRFPAWLAAALALAIAGGATLALASLRRLSALHEQDTLVVADFANTTGDATFNGALRLALMIQLEQSPSASVVTRDRTAAILQQMSRSPNEEIVGSVAREVCQRAGAKVLVSGSIAPLGEHYVVGLEALNCASGASIAHVQAQVPRREQVLKALGSSASRLRRRLGESIATIRQFDTPLEQATTPSLDALKAFSVADDLFLRAGCVKEAAPFLERAIELDRNFAMAYARLSSVSACLGRSDDEIKYAQAAYARRDHVTERERFYIDSRHCVVEPMVAGDCWTNVWNLWKRTYPRDWLPYANLAGSYGSQGDHEEALENGLEAIRLNPDGGPAYLNAVFSYRALGRYAEAKRLIDEAQARHVFEDYFHTERFALAFIAGDEAAMEKERLAVSGKRPAEAYLVWLDAQAAAFRGRLRQARTLRERVSKLDGSDTALLHAGRGAIFEAAVGRPVHIPDAPVLGALHLSANTIRYIYAAAAALSDDFRRASQLLAGDEVPPYFLPLVEACRALISAERGGGSRAEATVLSSSSPMREFLSFEPTYLHGVAYLRIGDGARAAAEFRRIMEHRGVDPTSPFYPLAYVQRARAHALEGDLVQARRDYETFFALWADADPEIPILREAKAEHAKIAGR